MLTVLAGGYLTLIMSNVRLSREVWQTYQDLADVRRESEFIRTDIARLSSIPVLQERSVELGYSPANEVEYMNVGSQ